MASQLFYKMVTEMTEAEKDQDHLNMVILSDSSMPDRTKAILSGDEEEVRRKLREDLQILARCGCEAACITCNTAHYFADQVGIKRVCAQLLPEEKVSNIMAIQIEGKAVCMIGDGVNDAPALKTANVGVAMGGLGSDIAADAADIVLMRDDISKLPYLKRLSNATVNTIKFSISLSM